MQLRNSRWRARSRKECALILVCGQNFNQPKLLNVFLQSSLIKVSANSACGLVFHTTSFTLYTSGPHTLAPHENKSSKYKFNYFSSFSLSLSCTHAHSHTDIHTKECGKPPEMEKAETKQSRFSLESSERNAALLTTAPDSEPRDTHFKL